MSDDLIKEEIERLERQRCEALMTGDVAALAGLVSEDLVHVHGNGHIDGNVDYLAGVAKKYRFHIIDRGPLRIRIYGDVVVVNGALEQQVSVNGIDKINRIKAIVTQTWIRTKGQWRQNTCHMGFISVE